MLFAVLCAVASVALGAGLGLAPRVGRPLMGGVQTFAIAAGMSVVVVHLLPESAEALGAWAFAAFFAGAAAPLVVEAALGVQHHPHHHHDHHEPDAHAIDVATEMGYLGLLAHQIGDGVGLSMTGLSPALGRNAALALSAHTVPITTLFVVRIALRHGRASALRHALGLAVATIGGIALGAAVPGEALKLVEPWITALVGGLLLHVICHDLAPDGPRSPAARSLDLAAMLGGLSIALVGSHARLEMLGRSAMAQRGFIHSLLDLSIQSAPASLIGLAAAALFRRRAAAREEAVASEGPGSDARRGLALALAPEGGRPLESARAMVARGAPAARVAAFLLAAPSTALWSTLLTWKFLSAGLALLRLALGVAIAGLAGAAAGALAEPAANPGPAPEPGCDCAPGGALEVFDELVLSITPWMVVGLAAAAYVDALVPAGQLAQVAAWHLDVPLLALAAIPSLFCAGAMVPLAAVLMGKGVSGGAVLGALLLGPATSVGGFRLMRRAYGVRSALAAHALFLALALAAAIGLNAMAEVTPDLLMQQSLHEHSTLALAAVAVLAAFGARSMWSTGLKGWLHTVLDLGEERVAPPALTKDGVA